MTEPTRATGLPPAPAAPDAAPAPRGRRRSRRTLLVTAGATALALAGGGVAAWGELKPRPLPVYIRDASENTRLAYAYAADHPEILRYIPCFCGCGERDGHESVLTCFVRDVDLLDRPVYDSHGAGCPICVGVVLDVRDRLAAGATLTEARLGVERFFSVYGPYATHTPMPPDHQH